jgi:type II secretory pathway component PulJ
MPMPRVRFTVRRMMIAVAIVACLIGGGLHAWRIYRKFQMFAEKAEFHSFREWQRRRLAAAVEGQAELSRKRALLFPNERQDLLESAEISEKVAKHEGTRADYQAALKTKYERAARFPWLPVEPDPPEPEL